MRTLASLLVLALLAAACGPSDAQVEVPRYLGEPNGDDAAMVGMLVIESDCLYVRSESSETVLMAFPSSVTKWDNGQQVLSLSGEDIPIGQVFLFGGSAMDVNRVGDLRWTTPPQQACSAGHQHIWLSGESARPIEAVPNLHTPTPRDASLPPLATPRSLTAREGLERDAAEYARTHNVSLAEAIAVLERQLGLSSTPTPSPTPKP
jgi:hypothetical protein